MATALRRHLTRPGKQLLADMEAEAEAVINQMQSLTKPYGTLNSDKVDSLVQAPERLQAKL